VHTTRVSGMNVIGNVQSQKIGKSNNLGSLWEQENQWEG